MQTLWTSRPDEPVAERRRRAAVLMDAVLDDTISVDEALLHWPERHAQHPDTTLGIAYQALWHWEADTERRQLEEGYADAQYARLVAMAQTLARGEAWQEQDAYWLASANQSPRFWHERRNWLEPLHKPLQLGQMFSRLFRLSMRAAGYDRAEWATQTQSTS